MSDEELDLSLAEPYDILHLKARVAEQNVFGTPQALLVELVGKHSADDELNECAKKLQEPVIFEDYMFGTFTLERRVNWFEAKTEWGGMPVLLTIPAEPVEDRQKFLSEARELWASQAEWQSKTKDLVIKELLPLKNEAWLEEGEPKVTPEEFVRKMVIESVVVVGYGHFEFWYNDGDLFWGHSIMVSGNLADGLEEAGIHG